MSRNTNLSELLFPVELRDIFLSSEDGNVQEIPNYKAVVNLKKSETISIVSKNYRLVTNKEALELAKKCFKQLFNTVNTDDMEIFNIITPKNKYSCHVDIIHREYKVNVWSQDVWVPYIRVTNSYNKSKALRFDLGFCRELCENGVIFEKQTIKLKFIHTKGEIAPEGEFDVDFEDLKKMELTFLEYMRNLKRFYVPSDFVLPVVCKALGIEFDLDSADDKKKERERNRLMKFRKKIDSLTDSYYDELGSNAYAVLNIMSDLATHPVHYNSSTVTDRWQKHTGNWIESFINKIESRNFSFEDYLGEYYRLNTEKRYEQPNFFSLL